MTLRHQNKSLMLTSGKRAEDFSLSFTNFWRGLTRDSRNPTVTKASVLTIEVHPDRPRARPIEQRSHPRDFLDIDNRTKPYRLLGHGIKFTNKTDSYLVPYLPKDPTKVHFRCDQIQSFLIYLFFVLVCEHM